VELDQGIQNQSFPDMTRGLVIGKFMPLHLGHVALIRFAASQCDELIVSLSYKPDDPIDGSLRFEWIQEFFKNEPNIKPAISVDDFDNEALPHEERTKLWATFIKKKFLPIDILFSSEEYGEPFGKSLGAKHTMFDPQRKQFPVSATLIRENPFRYWHFLPGIVRPFFVKKICFYGPESTGKSTMAKHFAKRYHTEFVPEVARELITSNDFTVEDIIQIGKAQTDRVKQKLKTANRFLFCDTDLITTEIYSQKYLKVIPEILVDLEKEIRYDLYFLFDIDVPWVADGLRDLNEQREAMKKVFEEELMKRKIEFIRVCGTWEQREKIIEGALQTRFPVR
jgi:HTH-type transcriptional repressor of NAD biosynthesis genes